MKSYYINFEKQGNELITIKVDAENLEDAYNKACRAYVESEAVDYGEVDKENLPMHDCPLIDGGSSEELDPDEESSTPSEEETARMKELLNIERRSSLDKSERLELQSLLDRYGYPEY